MHSSEYCHYDIIFICLENPYRYDYQNTIIERQVH